MNKKILPLICGSFLLTQTAFAESPFADAPQWSYQPVTELIDAKIIDGADARNFSASDVMTRYDMARLVGRAVYKIDKANAAQREIILRLAEEFKAELEYFNTPLPVQTEEIKPVEVQEQTPPVQPVLNQNDDGPSPEEITAVGDELRRQRRLPPFEFAAYARQIFEYTRHPQNSTATEANLQALDHRSNYDNHTSYYFYVISNLDKGYKFVTRAGINESSSDDRRGTNNFGLHWAALLGDIGHGTRFRLGRQNLSLGYGTVVNLGVNWDGINLINRTGNMTWRTGYFVRSDAKHRRYWFVSNETNLTDNLEVRAAYFHDSRARISDTYNRSSLYNVFSIGARYKFGAPFTLTAEYAHNRANEVYPATNAYFVQLNWRAINLQKPGTWTTWIQYRHADLGFNPHGFTEWYQPMKIAKNTIANSGADNVRGFEYGFSYVPFKNMLSSLYFWNLHRDGVQRNLFGSMLKLEYRWR